MTKEQFNWVWSESSRERILNQFYYEHEDLVKANTLINETINCLEFIKQLDDKSLINSSCNSMLFKLKGYQDE